MIRVDLHVHSTFSDGTCTPLEIVRAARARRVAVLALTDHDTLEGLDEFSRECRAAGIRPVRGVELSASAPITIHVLGYRIGDGSSLKKALDWVIERRNARNGEICGKLRDLGVGVNIEEVEVMAGGRVVGRPHIALWMVKNGFVPDTRAAFDRYLGKGAPAYVRREGLSPGDCVRVVRESGGLPVLAHPSLTGLDEAPLGELLDELKEYGLWGLECISSHCSSEAAYRYLRTADRHGLFPTAGSDFHGAARPDIALGVQVSEDFLPWARIGVNL
ncbi:MAG: PHP domain-containing protein [Synergistaceae bacterium]|jgi:predicted metal-dependent phosphoesterase TrpH|nr:PHP domain-containing protein [Synergistaceae bacterium]